MNENSLLIKYRPEKLEDVLGHESIIDSIKKSLPQTKAFILSGPSGLGKTTIGRIIGEYLEIDQSNFIEKNGSTLTSVDDARELLELLTTIPFTKNKNRLIIIDECHRLSKNAFDALLKPVEDSRNVYWVFLSSEATKIPKALFTRCLHYVLKPIDSSEIKKLLLKVIDLEKFTTPKDIVNYITIASKGCPRQALNYLAATYNTASIKDAKEIIQLIPDANASPQVIEFCRVLAKKGTFAEAVAILKQTEDEPESIRLVTLAYFSKVVISKPTDSYPLMVINAFSKPFYAPEKLAPLLLATANVLID